MKDNLENLIEGCKKRDPKAQRGLYDFLAPRMLAVCRRYVHDEESAEDVMQDGFVMLFDKITTYRGDGAFEGWARRIFVNAALMQIRKNDALKFSDNIEDSQAMQMVQANTLEKISADEIFKLVNSMPENFRSVFNLYVVEGYTHVEIAEMLSTTEGSSRSQLSRARAWLQNKIKNDELI